MTLYKNVDGLNIEMSPEEEASFWASTMIAEPPPPSLPQVYAIAQILIQGDEVTAVDTSSRLSGAFRLDVGCYLVFFAEPMPDTNYLALAYDGGSFRCFIRAEDKDVSSLIVNAVNLAGIPADPECISLEIKRIN